MSKHYNVRPSEILNNLFDLSGGDKHFIDEIAMYDKVQKFLDQSIKKLQKGSKKGFQKQQQKEDGPPKPRFVKSKFWKGKKFSKWD